MPILGCKIPVIGSLKTIMSEKKTIMSNDNIVNFNKVNNQNNIKEPIFSQGLYHWVMFILSYYTRVRENLKIDFETFVILQVVVSHSLYQLNKSGTRTFSELEDQVQKALELPKPGTGIYTIDLSDPAASQSWPPTRMEFNMKDQMARNQIDMLIKEIEEMKEEIKELRK